MKTKGTFCVVYHKGCGGQVEFSEVIICVLCGAQFEHKNGYRTMCSVRYVAFDNGYVNYLSEEDAKKREFLYLS